MTGFNFPWAGVPGQLINNHRLSAHPAGQLNLHFLPINLSGLSTENKPAIYHLRNMQHFMGNHLSGVTDSSRR